MANLFKRSNKKNKNKNEKKVVKQKKISKKLLLRTIISLFSVMLVLCVVLNIVLKKSYTEMQEQKIEQIANVNSKIVSSYLETMNNFAQTISNDISSYKNMETSVKEDLIKRSVNNYLSKNEDMFSVYFAFEPNKYFDETPQGRSYYIYKDENSKKIDIKNDYSNYHDKEFYTNSKKTKECHITEPWEFQLSNGKKVCFVTLGAPILDENNNFIGVANCDILTDTLCGLNYELGDYSKAGTCIITQKGNFVTDSTEDENLLKEFKAINKGDEERLNAVKDSKETKINGIYPKTNKKAIYYNVPIKIKGINKTWSEQFFVDESEAFKSVRIIMMIVVLICLGGLGILSFVAYRNLKKSLKPIDGIVKNIEQMGKGNLDIEKATSYSNDELGKLTRINESTADTLNSYIKEISDVLTQISNGNLDVEVTREYIGDFNEIKVSLNNISSSLNSVFAEMNVSAEQVFEGASQVSDGAQSLSQGATEQASAIEELSSTIKEITEQIKTNAKNAKTAREKAIDGSQATAESQEQMKRMISAMDEINDTSNEIGKIIRNIDDIAFQTNILALNAAVEAARAGSAGKGFAVVAEEVRNLAGKSAESAKSTATLIESSLLAIENGSKIVSETAVSLDKVVEGATQATQAIQLIAESSEEQAKSAEQINIGVGQISDVIQTNSATAEESAAASEELSGQSQMLKDLIGKFKLKNDDLSRDIKNNESDLDCTSLKNKRSNKVNIKPTHYIEL